MKLCCKTFIQTRTPQGQVFGSADGKKIQSTITFFKNPKSEKYSLILFTAQNKSGQKYALCKENIQQIRSRFLKSGKITLEFRQPPHNIFIEACANELHAFAKNLNNIFNPNKENAIKVSATPDFVPYKAAVTKLVVKQKADWPKLRFPPTLEILHLTDIGFSKLDRGILLLSRLKILNLENNGLQTLPVELSTLQNLSELHLRNNSFGTSVSTKTAWKWISGRLETNLKLLDLRENRLKIVPEQIGNLHQLQTLLLCGNALTTLPVRMRNLKRLHTLKVSNNSLISLPGAILLRAQPLEVLDVTGNDFRSEDAFRMRKSIFEYLLAAQKQTAVASLLEISGEAVLRCGVQFGSGDLPEKLIGYLNEADFCVFCRNPVFRPAKRDYRAIALGNVAKIYTSTLSTLGFRIPFACAFCSEKCCRRFSNCPPFYL